jgi:serine/threonine protein kinase
MKKLVFFTVILALLVSSVIAEERLTLSIGGELMERDMPQDIEEAQDLIRYLIDIANKADEKIENDYVQNLAEVESYKRQNEILQMKLEKLESKLNDISETNSEVKFDSPIWNNVSNNAKNFVKLCLERNRNRRPSAYKALDHPWFSNVLNATHRLQNLKPDILISIKNFNIKQRFKQMIIKH